MLKKIKGKIYKELWLIGKNKVTEWNMKEETGSSFRRNKPVVDWESGIEESFCLLLVT